MRYFVPAFVLYVVMMSSIMAEVFSQKSELPWAAQVSKVSNCIIKNEAFLKEVETFSKFTHTAKTPKEVALAIKNFRPVVVSTYKTKNPWSAAIATTYSSDKTTVYFNTRKNPRPLPAMVNTAFHEGLHLNGFSHGNNSPKGKENSVNYRVGKIAEKYVEVCK